MKKWRVAIIGAGYMAQEHAKAFASTPSVEIAGIFSRTPARAEALAATYGARTFGSVADLYEGTRADVVIITVTEMSMRDICLAAFRHPWLCLIEKPAGLDFPQALEIQAAQHAAGVRAFVALNRRAYSATRKALAELATSEGPRLISVLDQEDLVAVRAAGQPPEVIRNYMFANSIHLIDYFTFLARGDLVAVECSVPWSESAPGYVVATLRYSSGDIGVYQAVWAGPGPWSVTVTDHKVRLEMRPIEKLGVQRRGERRLTEVDIDPIDTEFKPGLKHQAEQTILALQGQPNSLASLDEATRSMALCADIYGRRV